MLWHDTTSMAGPLVIEPGQHLGAHAHRENHHHTWVLEGRATIVGKEVGDGQPTPESSPARTGTASTFPGGARGHAQAGS